MSDKGFVDIYPMCSNGDLQYDLQIFFNNTRLPITLVVNPSGEQKSKQVRKFCHQVGNTLRLLEEPTKCENRDEIYTGLLKESIREDIRASNFPMILWYYCDESSACIHNVIPLDIFQLNGNTNFMSTFGVQGDI